MTNKKEEQLGRMKALMNYGLQTESKQAPYSSVEFTKAASDNKTYGIIREGAKFFIKVADTKPNLVKEDFNYIGGFRNRKDYEYDSFANAQKNFELKLRSVNEAYDNRSFSTEAWDLDKKERVVVEATDKMKQEILRERQIMRNAVAINEKKEIDDAICCTQKNNIKCEKPETGEAKDGVFTQDGEKVLPKEMKESVVKEEEVLAWHDSNGNPKGDHYMDKSHGTEIGDSAPFDDAKGKQITDNGGTSTTGEMKNGVVEEGASMHDADNQNTPTPGTGEIGDDQPFNGGKGKQIDEALDIDDTVEDDELGDGEGDDLDIDVEDGEGDDLDVDIEGGEGDELGDEPIDDEPIDDDAIEGEGDDVFEDDLASRLDAIEELVRSMADKLGVSAPAVDADAYGDDDIFDDGGGEDVDVDIEGGDGEGDDYELELDDEYDAEGGMPSMPMESRRPMRIIESPRYRRLMEQRRRMNEEGMTPFKDAGRVPSGNMNKLDDFGKHPAYQKKVMELPPKDFTEFPDYYDMNDDSVRNDSPYGEKIGSGAPFEIDPDTINNAIAESIKKLGIGLKKK